ncbi:cytochrome P450 52A11 [Apiospora arundinis]
MSKPEPLGYSPSQEDQFLLSDDTSLPETVNSFDKRGTNKKSISLAALLHLAASLCWMLGIIALCLVILLRQPNVVAHCPPDDIYQPAQYIIDYQTTTATFDPAYMGEPGHALDEAWEMLYNHRRLVEEAQKTSGRHGYIVTLNVFHQLHCLNGLRKLGRPEYYKRPGRRDEAGFMDFYEHRLIDMDCPLHPELASGKIPASAWRSFERGPRKCIGQELANIEARDIIALVVIRYEISNFGLGELATDEKGQPVLSDDTDQLKAKSLLYPERDG